MTAAQAYFRSDTRPKQNAFRLGVVVCLALLALLTVIQIAHFHPYGYDFDKDAGHCPLCISMQTAAPVAVTAAVVVLIRVGSSTSIYKARAVIRQWHPKLFTRPPPIGC